MTESLSVRGHRILQVAAGKAEDILPKYLHPTGSTLILGHSEVASEEARTHPLPTPHPHPPTYQPTHPQVIIEAAVKRALGPRAQLRLQWGATLFHLDDIGLKPTDIPTVFTEYRNKARRVLRVLFAFDTRSVSDSPRRWHHAVCVGKPPCPPLPATLG